MSAKYSSASRFHLLSRMHLSQQFDEYALRDINEGEELLCDYGDFFSLDFLDFEEWKLFGL